MKTRQTRSAAALAGLPSTGGAAARQAHDAQGRLARTAGHPCPDAHGTRPQSLWKVSGALWAGMGAALLSASLLLAASPATAADKAGAKAAPIKAATRAAAGSAAAQEPEWETHWWKMELRSFSYLGKRDDFLASYSA